MTTADTERSWEDDFEAIAGHRYPCFGANTCPFCLQVTNTNLEDEVERLRQENERLSRAAAGMRAFAHALHKGPMETCTEGGCLVARLALAESPTSG